MAFSANIEQALTSAAARYSLPADFLRAVIQVESRGNPLAVSPTGAKGVMQLGPDTVTTLKVKDPFDVAQNVNAGSLYLRHLIDRFGSWERALAAYNWGPSHVAVTPMSQWPKSVQDYVSAVFDYWVPGAQPAFVSHLEPEPVDAPPEPVQPVKPPSDVAIKLAAAAGLFAISIAIIKSGVLNRS